jgi:hypothetical protein
MRYQDPVIADKSEPRADGMAHCQAGAAPPTLFGAHERRLVEPGAGPTQLPVHGQPGCSRRSWLWIVAAFKPVTDQESILRSPSPASGSRIQLLEKNVTESTANRWLII